VDDNPVNLTIGARLMESLGLRVDRADNGPDAIRCCRRESYDLVFMDIQMPMMSGLDAARQIRRLSPVPIVAMTANVQERDRLDCHQAGMSDFLTKPFRQQDLIPVLERFLQARAKQSAGQ